MEKILRLPPQLASKSRSIVPAMGTKSNTSNVIALLLQPLFLESKRLAPAVISMSVRVWIGFPLV
jgi:hypothetical protein